MFQWNSEQYTKFEKERTQPSIDLINRLDIQPKTVLDIGCGPGNSTNQLYERFPDANILGIDNSDNMLCKARNSYPKLRFVNCFIPDELDRLDSFDLIFSNACLHWIPEHSSLYGRLMSCLNEGGVLAVQMPLVQYAPFYKILNELVAEKKWESLRSIQNFHNLLPDDTYDALAAVSDNIEMWDTTYYHIVDSHQAVIDWYKGSGLRPYLETLNDANRDDFLSELYERIAQAMPIQNNGKLLLKMPRLFFIARI